MDDQTTQQTYGALLAKKRERLIPLVAEQLRSFSSDAVKLEPDEEVDLYRRPTSPEAVKILEAGGTLEEAEAANTAYWLGKKAAQQLRMQQGATPKDLAQEGLTDAAIWAECRRHAHELKIQNGKNDPAEEVKYDERMAQKVAQARMGGLTDAAVRS